jgi:putative transposase
LTGGWVPHDTRAAVIDFVRRWSDKANIGLTWFIRLLAVAKNKFYSWIERYGKAIEHNVAVIPATT